MPFLLACLLVLLTACAPAVGPARTAFWLRPPASAAELERTLTEASKAGFTDVLLEGFYHGRTVWPSGVAPMKTNYDALGTALRVGEREGLHVSVWFEMLYWRPAPRFGVPTTPLWRDEWATRTATGQTSLELSDLGFVSPAEPGVGEALEALVREVATRYPAAGLHLDYLRYPREAGFGYDPALLAAFEAQTGLDARTLRPGDDENLARWRALRRNAVTTLANRLIAAYRDAGGRGLVSAAVYQGNDPLQDWREWRGLQVAMPMFYLPQGFAGLYPLGLFGFARDGSVWPGLRVGGGYPALSEQLVQVRGLGFSGVAVFGWTPPEVPR